MARRSSKPNRPRSQAQMDLGGGIEGSLEGDIQLNLGAALPPLERDWELEEGDRILGHKGISSIRSDVLEPAAGSVSVAPPEVMETRPTPPPIAEINETLRTKHLPKP